MSERRRREEPRLPAAFSRLLLSWFAAQSADGMRFAALPLLAYFTERTPGAVAGVAAATSLPWLLVALPAGLIVDRMDSARVMAWANLVRGLAAVLVIVAIATDSVSIVLLGAIGFGLTAAETFTDSAAQSLLVQMVPTEQLERANARFVSSENVGFDLIGPLSAGALFTLAHWAPFVVAALAFAVAALVMLTLDSPGATRSAGAVAGSGTERSAARAGTRPGTGDAVDTPGATAAEREASTGPQRIRTSIGSAFAAVFADPVLRSLVITVAVLAATVAAVEGVLVVYATGPLGLPDALFPTLLACYSIGLLGSAPFVSRVVRRYGSGGVMLGVIGVAAITLMVLGAFPHRSVAWVCFVVMGAAFGFWNILSATRRQRRTPKQITAAVSSAFRTMAWGAVPLGAALGGLGAEHWGVARVFLVAGVVVLVLGVIMARPFLRPVGADAAGADEHSIDGGLAGDEQPPPVVAIEHGLPE